MNRDELVDKFDACFGFVMGTEAQRKRFFDWVMKQQAAQQSFAADETYCSCTEGLLITTPVHNVCGYCNKPFRR